MPTSQIHKDIRNKLFEDMKLAQAHYMEMCKLAEISFPDAIIELINLHMFFVKKILDSAGVTRKDIEQLVSELRQKEKGQKS